MKIARRCADLLGSSNDVSSAHVCARCSLCCVTRTPLSYTATDVGNIGTGQTTPFPRTYEVPGVQGTELVRIDSADALRLLRTELELLRRTGRIWMRHCRCTDHSNRRHYSVDETRELAGIVRCAIHPVVDETIRALDNEFADLRKEILMSVVNEEAENIVQDAIQSGAVDPNSEDIASPDPTATEDDNAQSIVDALAQAEAELAEAAGIAESALQPTENDATLSEDDVVDILNGDPPEDSTDASIAEAGQPEAADPEDPETQAEADQDIVAAQTDAPPDDLQTDPVIADEPEMVSEMQSAPEAPAGEPDEIAEIDPSVEATQASDEVDSQDDIDDLQEAQALIAEACDANSETAQPGDETDEQAIETVAAMTFEPDEQAEHTAETPASTVDDTPAPMETDFPQTVQEAETTTVLGNQPDSITCDDAMADMEQPEPPGADTNIVTTPAAAPSTTNETAPSPTMAFTPEAAEQAVADIEQGLRKLTQLLNTQVNDQWRHASDALQEIMQQRDELSTRQQQVDEVLAELARIKEEASIARDDAELARREAKLFREDTLRAKERADTSAAAAELAANQARQEAEHATNPG